MSTVDPRLVSRLQVEAGQLLGAAQRRRRQDGAAEFTGEDERQLGREFIRTVIGTYQSELVEDGQAPLSREVEAQLASAIEARQFGAGSLQHLLENEDLENIDINGCDAVFVTHSDGRVERVEPVAESDEELIQQIKVLGAYAGLSSRPFDAANPELDLRLPDGSRLSAIQGNTTRPAVSIRRHRYMKVSLADLVGNGTMTNETAEFLRAAVRARLNIMVAGATSAGKTTLLRALANEILASERIITIENSLEIGLGKNPEAHPNLVEMEESLPNSEGQGGVTMAQLLRRTLRMNPDRVIVGEVLGPEVVTMLNAMSQGNDGSLSTIHARSAHVALERLATYGRQAAERLEPETTAQMVASGLDLVVFLRRGHRDGQARRSVREIVEVAGYDRASVVTTSLFYDDGSGSAVRNADVLPTGWRTEALEQEGWQDREGGDW